MRAADLIERVAVRLTWTGSSRPLVRGQGRGIAARIWPTRCDLVDAYRLLVDVSDGRGRRASAT